MQSETTKEGAESDSSPADEKAKSTPVQADENEPASSSSIRAGQTVILQRGKWCRAAVVAPNRYVFRLFFRTRGTRFDNTTDRFAYGRTIFNSTRSLDAPLASCSNGIAPQNRRRFTRMRMCRTRRFLTFQVCFTLITLMKSFDPLNDGAVSQL